MKYDLSSLRQPLVISVSFLSMHVLHAQVQWMHQGGIGGQGRGIAVDGSGGVYVAGVVNAPALFDEDTVASHFADAFIARYDGAGNVLWVHTGGAELIDQVNDIAVDADGNVYVTGFYNTNGVDPTVAFDGQQLTGLGSTDLFVAKYDAGGTLQWIRQGGGSQAEEGRGIAITPSGTIIVSGFFQGSATFGSTTLTSAGLSDVLLVGYDADGNTLWAQRHGGAGDDKANKLTALPDDDIAVVGTFQQAATFGGTTLNASGLGDFFVARFDDAGNAQWAARAGSDVSFAIDQAFDIDHAANGDLLLCGEITGPADFDAILLTPNGGVDLFIARYDGDGNALWAHHAGGPQVDHAYGIAVDAGGNSYLTGQADDGATTVFDTITLAPFGNEAVFLAKYDAGGAVQWVRRYAPGLGGAVAVESGDCLYFTGGASGIVGQPAFDSVNWQYVDRAIFTARFCAEAVTGMQAVPSDKAVVMLYPNPATDRITIALPKLNGVAVLSLMDAAGRVLRIERATRTLQWDTTDLPDGLYEVHTLIDGVPSTHRLVVVH